MNPSHDPPCVTAHQALVRYAAVDSNLLFSDFMRRVLLFVYADTAVLAYRAHAQRTLAFRLLARSESLGRRFLQLRLRALRQDCLLSVAHGPIGLHSPEVLGLAREILESSRVETSALLRMLRDEDPACALETSHLSPLRFAQALEECLADFPLSTIERGIVFKAWAGAFGATMRSTYSKYLRVLEHRSEIDWDPRPIPETGT